MHKAFEVNGKGYIGSIHISQLSYSFVAAIEDTVSIGEFYDA